VAKHPHSTELFTAIKNESEKFLEYYGWLKMSMPPAFFEEISHERIMLITHSLMGFALQDFFSQINLKRIAIILCVDSPDADIRILEKYSMHGIKNYQAYVSQVPLPDTTNFLRVVTIYFTEAIETIEKPYPEKDKEELRDLYRKRNPEMTDAEFDALISEMNTIFLRSVPPESLILSLDMYVRAKTRDNCQYEVRYNQEWAQHNTASMQVVFAWRNTPKHHFLYKLTKAIHRHHLVMRKVNATYIDPYSEHNVLIMALELHGMNGEAVWDVADIPDFMRELVTLKYFDDNDAIDLKLVSRGVISGNMGNLLRAAVNFIHQALVHIDPNIYTVELVEEALCRHPELTAHLCEAFKLKFDPDYHQLDKFYQLRQQFLNAVSKLDTGQEENDLRRRNILTQAMSFVTHTLKTNFYRHNLTAYSFRLDPIYLDAIPFERVKKFPDLPFAIFFFKGMHFFGFHIRFKELARGGLRTVFPEQQERMIAERNNVFTECYYLAHTQQKKNKDIPEGGAKGVIFLKPFDRLESEAEILQSELEVSQIDPEEVKEKTARFRKEQKVEYLYQAQRAYVESFITVINAEPNGKLKAKYMVDYWKKPEYIYLGPDENMQDPMIQWIADFSKKYDYKPGSAFISSKPVAGINHKQYGVTSLGLNVYLHEVLNYLGINPLKQTFTVKMTGGPDGDVAGNQIYNLYRFYPHTAKLIALTDGSGTIYDPQGLDLKTLVELFKAGKAICHYPPLELSEGGLLLDKRCKRSPSSLSQQTLCYKKSEGKVVEEWLSGNEMNALYRNNVHGTPADIFIPAGGRPRTLNEHNFRDFLAVTGVPTAKAIVEGANLYLNAGARKALESLGVLIIKDSSANKGGVICSSFEVQCGLVIDDETFMAHKERLVKEILKRIEECCYNEAALLLRSYNETGVHLTILSEKVSYQINKYKYELLDYLESLELSDDPQDPLIRCFLGYCLPFLRENYEKELIEQIPEHHKKAMIAVHLASQLVYRRGLDWSPSIVDILPLVLQDVVT
jgi:glutamate dehydrogenase